MSSFIGHALAGLTVSVVPKPQRSVREQLLRSGWLVAIACAPDLDYFVPILHPSANNGVRLTHSLFFCLLLPLATIAMLALKGDRGSVLRRHSLQTIAAGLSHLGLDLMVGVSALPLLFPYTSRTYKLPFGLLPSAGALDFSNYYLYRNLFIELGVLLPLFAIAIQISRGRYSRILIGLTSISIAFMVWSFRLSR